MMLIYYFQNNDPIKIQDWAYKCKISFNLSISSQTQDIYIFLMRKKVFSRLFLTEFYKRMEYFVPNIRICIPYNRFCKALLNFVGNDEKKVYNIHGQVDIKLLSRLRLGFRHLCKHKCCHNFEYALNPLYSCSFETTRKKLHRWNYTALFTTLPLFQCNTENSDEWLNEYRQISLIVESKWASQYTAI